MSPDIRHLPDQRRFEIDVEGHTGVLEYRIDGDTVSMDSVRVPDAIGGRGVAGALTRFALDHARAEGWRVVPRCPYVKRWTERHPEYADLLTG